MGKQTDVINYGNKLQLLVYSGMTFLTKLFALPGILTEKGQQGRPSRRASHNGEKR